MGCGMCVYIYICVCSVRTRSVLGARCSVHIDLCGVCCAQCMVCKVWDVCQPAG